MPIRLLLIVFVFIMAITSYAKAGSDLPVDVRADILLQEIIRAAKSGQSKAALKKIDEYRSLENEGHKTPPAVLFFEAKQAFKVGQHERAFVALEDYLAVANRSESTYKEAVKLYSSMKDKADPVEASRLRISKLRPGSIFQDCNECPAMVVVPAGSTFAEGFALGKTEVTQGQWKAIMGNNPSIFKTCGDDCPVDYVSWNDAKEFIMKLNTRTGKQYRLPSEAEWEYACHAERNHRFCGSDSIDSVAWYGGNSHNMTHRVGSKQPNTFGLHDMSGNVWEWVEDCFHSDCGLRVLRGGSWQITPNKYNPSSTDAADYYFDEPASRNSDYGFRLARMLP